jgi:hypothetical protein
MATGELDMTYTISQLSRMRRFELLAIYMLELMPQKSLAAGATHAAEVRAAHLNSDQLMAGILTGVKV